MSVSPTPSDKISRKEYAIFSIGGGVQQFAAAAPVYLANPIFNLALGLSPIAIGLVLALGRLWDALLAPIVGHFSDNTHTRWGRRRPYMIVGAFLLGVSFAAMWWLPREKGHTFYFSYFLLSLLVFYLGETLYSVPWTALGIERTSDYNARTRLFAGASVADKLVSLLANWLYPIAQLAVFQGVLNGVRVLGCICGTVLIVMCLVIPLTWRESNIAAPGPMRAKEPLGDALKVIIRNKVMIRFAAACLITMMSLTSISSLGLYINIYHVFHGDKMKAAGMMALLGSSINLLCIVSVPLILYFSRRFGKHRAMITALGLISVSAALKFILFTPNAPFLQLWVALLYAPGYSAYTVLVGSMTADIVDYDESLNGRRREALIAAATSWITKMGISLSYILAGLILFVTGFDAALGANQLPGTVLGMRVLFCAIPAFGCTAALLLLRNYPLTKARMTEIHAICGRPDSPEGEIQRGAV